VDDAPGPTFDGSEWVCVEDSVKQPVAYIAKKPSLYFHEYQKEEALVLMALLLI